MSKTTRPQREREPWEQEASRGYPAQRSAPLEMGENARPQTVISEGQSQEFDLEDRTARFGEAIIRFCKKMPDNSVNCRIISQLVGCGTSVGANYCEADDSVSKKEFLNKIGTCKKEAREAKFFLRMAATAEPVLKEEARNLWREARELHLIFCKIYRTGRGRG
jgi:four helix bundle protein